jgi:hypothetical protein
MKRAGMNTDLVKAAGLWLRCFLERGTEGIVLKGHGFSPAAEGKKESWALAPEGWF